MYSCKTTTAFNEDGGHLVKETLPFFSSNDFPIQTNLHHPTPSSRLSQACCFFKKSCLLHAFLLWVFAISLVALTLSAVALQRSERANYFEQEVSAGDITNMEENALDQLEVMLEITGEMKFSHLRPPHGDNSGILSYEPQDKHQRRNAQDKTEDTECYSTNETDAKPLAHIVSPPAHPRTIIPNDDAAFSILTKQWECGVQGNRGMVRGGTKFHRNSGFLELPRAGVYYVYSQVTFRPAGDRRTRVVKTRLVACFPGDECNYPITTSENDDVFLQTESDVNGRYGNSKFQAGMFYFPAGVQIAVLAFNERYNKRELAPVRYDSNRYNTYMGVFLVDEDSA